MESRGEEQREAQRMSIDQCQRVGDMDDSELAGLPITHDGDSDFGARREGNLKNVEVKIEVKVEEGSLGKRKRGRPPRGQPKTPVAKRNKDEEDVCFICFDGGSLVLCDRRGCPKAYHPACIKRDESFFRSKAKWNCGWHICSICQKASHYMCYTCTYSLCKGCTKGADYVCVRGNKGFCGLCMRTVMLIENGVQGTQETCQVDFDDKSSWEYLFKVYWIYLKKKLSLTMEELTQAKNPWKEAAVAGCEGRLYVQAKNYKRRLTKNPSQFLDAGHSSLSVTNSGSDRKMPLAGSNTWASKELLEFIAHMNNGNTTVLSRFDVETLLLQYVKKNNLRDPHQRSHVICDSQLIKLFGQARVGHIEMLKLLESHLFMKDNAPDRNISGVADKAFTCMIGGEGNYDNHVMIGSDKRSKTHKKADMEGMQNNVDAYAAINVNNINLIYLRRNLFENLVQDADKFHDRVVGSIVRIRIPTGGQKLDLYRLVQVVGTTKVAEPYKVGTRSTDFMLEIVNLNKKEVISIDEISNQNFSEDECRRLRQSIKYGLSRRLTVDEILEKAIALQAVRVQDLLEAEILRLSHLRDRASEKGHRKELRECVEKLQQLNSTEEHQRRLHEIPDVQCDPKMDPSYVSDEDAGNIDQKQQDESVLSGTSYFDRKGKETISPRSGIDILSDVGNRELNILAANCEQSGNACSEKSRNNSHAPGTGDFYDIGAARSELSCSLASDVSSLPLPTRVEQFTQYNEIDKMWHYEDPSGRTQGPFSMLQLRMWNGSGHFPPDLRIWKMNETKSESILLTDALNGNFNKSMSMVCHGHPLFLGGHSLNDRDNNLDGSRIGEILTNGKTVEGSWKVDDFNARCNGNDESAGSNGWISSGLGAPTVIHKEVRHNLKDLDSSKSDVVCNEKPQVSYQLFPAAFSRKSDETLSDQARESQRAKKNLDDIKGNQHLDMTSEVQSNSIRVCQKNLDCTDHPSQSSGNDQTAPENNPPKFLELNSALDSETKMSQQNEVIDFLEFPFPTSVNSSSSGKDSRLAFVPGVKESERNQEFSLLKLPSPTPKQTYDGLKGRAADEKQSMSTDVAVQNAGPSWSTGSSLVTGIAQIPEVAVDWKPNEAIRNHTASTSPLSVQPTHASPSHATCNASSWEAIINEPNEFSSLVDESVSDLLAEVEAMESLGGLDSPTSIMNCREEFTDGSKNECLSSAEGLSPVPDLSKGDALSSTGDVQLPSQSTMTEEQNVNCQADAFHHQRIYRGHSSTSTEAEVGPRCTDVSVSSHQWEASPEFPPMIPPRTWEMAASECTRTLGSEGSSNSWRVTHQNAHLGHFSDQGSRSMGWGGCQGTAQENASVNPCTSSVGTRNGSDRYFGPRDRGFHGRDSSGFCCNGRGRNVSTNRHSYFVGGGNGNSGGSFRPMPKGQRVCKFYESGYCKKGASCGYLHP